MNFRLYILCFVLITINCYSQEKHTEKTFFTNSQFNWEEWEFSSSDSLKTKIIAELKSDLSTESLFNVIDVQFEKFHLIDVNSDGQKDIVYNGFLGSEKNSVILFVYENGKYVEKINTFGEIIEIKRDLDYLPMSFKILDSPCCEDIVYSFEEYNYSIEDNKIVYRNSIKIKFLNNTVFPNLKSSYESIQFKTTSESYNLRNSPEITNEVNNNIVSVYPKGSLGTAIYSKRDRENENRVWWFVIMHNNKHVLNTNLYCDDKDDNYFTMGWMSDKTLLEITR